MTRVLAERLLCLGLVVVTYWIQWYAHLYLDHPFLHDTCLMLGEPDAVAGIVTD